MTTYLKSHLTIPEIIESKWHPHLKRKVLFPEVLKEKVLQFKTEGKKIVTLNGSFDLMHSGHLKILSEAFDQKKQSGILIVALNSDASIQSYKSKNRPIIDLIFRLEMMASCEFVDFITWFEEDNPIKLLKDICPDIHVNGSEYRHSCIEQDAVIEGGGVVHFVERVEGLSTSAIIKKIEGLRN